ncbi:putative T7SS-secreted protein [Nocardia inohanensis]|uniref:putative T7SS-secreted protein n=1 Tax=Nocardia inohanensis TaxID=209246 RepID=UPI0008343ECF|nr:DUF6531 domain-containing protein [Nocardia inohanensis]
MGLSNRLGLDNLVDIIDRGVEKATETLGHAADTVLEGQAALADKLGLDGVSQFLNDLGDQIESATGGAVDERELWQSEDPKELIRGEPAEIDSAVKTLEEMAKSIASTGDALRAIDTANWTGKGADSFNAVYDKQPKLWWDSSEAFTATAGHLNVWSHAVQTAQTRAAEAVTEWKRAATEEDTKKKWWNSLTGEQQKQQGSLKDTWSEIRRNAHQILLDARSQRDTTATEIAAKIAESTGKAPEKPPFTSRVAADFSDLGDIAEHAKSSFTNGFLTGLSSTVAFIRAVNPTDTYNMTHPAEYQKAMSNLATGLVVAASDPAAVLDTMVTEARTNPFEFAGMLTSEVALNLVTGGGGSAKTAVSLMDKAGTAAVKTTRLLDDLPTGVRPKSNLGDNLGGGHGPSHTAPSVEKPVAEKPSAGLPRETEPAPNTSVDAGTQHGPAPESAAPKLESEAPGPATRAEPEHDAPVSHGEPQTEAPSSPRDRGETGQPGTHTNLENPSPRADSPASHPSADTPPRSEAPSGTHPASEAPAHAEPNSPRSNVPESGSPAATHEPNPGAAKPESHAPADHTGDHPGTSREPNSPGTQREPEAPTGRTPDADPAPSEPAPTREPGTTPVRDTSEGAPSAPKSDAAPTGPKSDAAPASLKPDADPSPNRLGDESPGTRAPEHAPAETRVNPRTEPDTPGTTLHPNNTAPNHAGRAPESPSPTRPHENSSTRPGESANNRPHGRDPEPARREPSSERAGTHPDESGGPRHSDPEPRDRTPDAEHRTPADRDGTGDGATPRPESPAARITPDEGAPHWPGESGTSHGPGTHDGPGVHDRPGHSEAPDHKPDSDGLDSKGTPEPDGAGGPKHGETEPAADDSGPTYRADSDQQQLGEGSHDSPEHSQTPDKTDGCGDPVDAATGEFFVPETDLTLPGILPLVLVRRHRSNYRLGRWFGPSWSATLDIRLVVTDQSVTFIGEDGLILNYPHPEVDHPVTPTTSALRWTLARTDTGGYRVWDCDRELLWHFAPDPVLGGLDAALGNYAISAITDRHRNRIRFHYDADGNPLEITHTGGYTVRLTTAEGRVTSLAVVDRTAATETLIPVRHFGYDSGELTSVTNSYGGTTRYTYDEHHRMLSWTDSNDNYMLNTYDEHGRIIRQDGIGGVLSCEFDYFTFPDGTGTLTTHTNSLGARTSRGYDADLRLRDVLDPAGAQTHYDYNTDRNPLRVVAPDGATTQYTYTEQGDVASIVRPDGHSIDIEYLFRHRPIRITDVDGTVQQREWDANGNLTAVIDPLGTRIEYTHHPTGAVATITEPNGAKTEIESDPTGLPIRVTDPEGAQTLIERDAFGRPRRVTDALGSPTTYLWTPDGKPLHRTDANGHTESWTYDAEGNLLTHTNPAGGTTRYTYGAFDLPATRTDHAGFTTTYTHDTERRLTSVTNPNGQTWHYQYDPAGHLTSQTDYNGAATTYTHDLTGRTTTITPATGVTRHHTHDLLGRLTSVITDSGDWITYTHDLCGSPVTATTGINDSPIHTLQFTYTPTGLLESQQLDDQPPMRFAYDNQGRRTSRTSPTGGETHWRYDYLGRPSALTADGHDINFTYDPVGRLTRWQVAELAIDHTYDPVGRLLRQDVTAHPPRLLNLGLDSTPRPFPHQLRSDEYTWRPDGYITNRTINRPGVASVHNAYALDPLGRVATLTRNSVTAERYTYDALSNITDSLTPMLDPVTTTPDLLFRVGSPQHDSSREYRNNLLIRDGRHQYTYDESGRLVRKTKTRLSRKPDVWHYRYNDLDQLTDVWTPDHQWWHYTYDAFGRRVGKQHLTADGAVIERVDFCWDDFHLIEQSAHTSTTRWHYGPESYAPLTQGASNQEVDREFYAIVSDLVGTPLDLVDPVTCRHVATARADLWGITSWHGDADTPLRMPGQIYDAESGLHYNLYRVYDPATGRFLTQDPLGLDPAPNPGVYPHNPLSWTDPLGLTPVCEKNGENPKQKEVEVGPFKSFEQARNEALRLLGEINPATREPYVGRLEVATSTYGKVVGFTTRVGDVFKRLRIDFDPVKGPHFNVEVGKGPSAKKWAVKWAGTEDDVMRLMGGNL